MNRQRIFDIAEKTRQDFERRLVSEQHLIDLYVKYDPCIPDPVAFIRCAKTIFPEGNCGIASLYLQELLGGKILHAKYKGEGHTVLEIDDPTIGVDGLIVDITADQFGGPKMYIGPLQPPWSSE